MWKPWAMACVVISSALPAWAETPKVAVSIQPLHSLAAAVMQGVGSPDLLVTGAASEHTYALKPSDARKVAQADLLVLVDERHEAFLEKPLKARDDKKQRNLIMAELPGMRILPPRKGGAWEPEHEERGDDHQDAEPAHHHGNLDGHVWLDPTNARVMTAALAATLAEMDPVNAAAYARNAQAVATRLEILDNTLRSRLSPLAGQPYVVFHDAYQYLETRYGLTPAGAITIDPERPPSAKRMAALRQRLSFAQAPCVFREPQFPAPVVEILAQSVNGRVGLLDPQGADLPPGPDQYFTLMERLADSLNACLGR